MTSTLRYFTNEELLKKLICDGRMLTPKCTVKFPDGSIISSLRLRWKGGPFIADAYFAVQHSLHGLTITTDIPATLVRIWAVDIDHAKFEHGVE